MEASSYLLGIPMWTREKNSLADVRCFLGRLGHPDRSMRIIHVAGTNGKGSVCAFMASVLLAAGYRTGAFVSPHLVDIRERLLVDGRAVEKEAFQAAFEAVYRVTREMMEQGFHHPTFFEFLFLMSMVAFRDEKLDYVILETGLGGRLDTTNVIERPLACAITSISLDHMEYLGSTVGEIAGEKAGIIKEGIPVAYDASDEVAARVVEGHARRLYAPSCPVRESDFTGHPEDGGWRMNIHAPSCGGPFMACEDELFVPSLAPYQRMNALLAVRTLLAATGGKLDLADVREGIRKTRWPGRMEEVLPGVYLDGAHNPGGVRAMARTIRSMPHTSSRPKVLLFTAVEGKDYREMADILAVLDFGRVFITRVSDARGLDAESLKDVFASRFHCPVEDAGSVQDAFDTALRAKGDGGLLFCLGSLYLIGEIKALTSRHGIPPWKRMENVHDRL